MKFNYLTSSIMATLLLISGTLQAGGGVAFKPSSQQTNNGPVYNPGILISNSTSSNLGAWGASTTNGNQQANNGHVSYPGISIGNSTSSNWGGWGVSTTNGNQQANNGHVSYPGISIGNPSPAGNVSIITVSSPTPSATGNACRYGETKSVSSFAAIPSGWGIINQVNGFYTIKCMLGARFGNDEELIESSPLPTGWGITRVNNGFKRAIYLGGASRGATVWVLAGPAVPPGWVVLRALPASQIYIPYSSQLYIEYIVGHTYGTTRQIHDASSIPTDWVVTRTYNGFREIASAYMAPIGSEMRIMAGSPIPAGWVLQSNQTIRKTSVGSGIPNSGNNSGSSNTTNNNSSGTTTGGGVNLGNRPPCSWHFGKMLCIFRDRAEPLNH